MTQSSPVYVSLEFTPNPNTLKYSVNRELLKTRSAANFTAQSELLKFSPLAQKLLAVPGISGVMIGKDFVTVTKTEEGDWDTVHKNTSSLLENHLIQNELVVDEKGFTATQESKGGSSAIEKQIIDILDAEVRPAVAMDGGDISFDRYEDGIVYLHMQGSCAGCPSSTLTLKSGIETRLKAAIPEIIEVVSV
jgi:Fe-S cluster biogenesis protein NfuA